MGWIILNVDPGWAGGFYLERGEELRGSARNSSHKRDQFDETAGCCEAELQSRDQAHDRARFEGNGIK